MNTIKKDKTTYNLHFIKTDKFKNIQVSVSLKSKIKKEDITIRNFLTSILTYSTLKYNTKRKLAIKTQDLYGSSIISKNSRLGNYLISEFRMSTLEEKYTEEKMVEESIKLLSEVIFNPNVHNLKFDEESFNIIYKNMESEIKSFKESTDNYSITRMYENMNDCHPVSYRMIGYLEDLKKITRENLYTYYKNFIKNSIVDIYVIGNFDEDSIEKIIEDNFKFYKINKEINPYVEITKKASKERKIIETDEFSQSKLAIGCDIKDLTEFERKYVITLFNLIYGVTTDCKLFRIVREKYSLAYYIYSRVSKLDNTILIASGIESKNFEKTVKLIKEQLEEVKKGNFSEKDIEKAVTFFISSLEQLEDSQSQILDNYISMQLLGIDDIETRKKKIKEVTKEDIMKIVKKIKINTIYLLKGEKLNEEN